MLLTKYYTATGANPNELDMQVNRLLMQGWTLYGTPYIWSHARAGELFCQALIQTAQPEERTP